MELGTQDAECSGGLTCGLRRMLTVIQKLCPDYFRASTNMNSVWLFSGPTDCKRDDRYIFLKGGDV